MGTDALWPLYILGGVGLPTLFQHLVQLSLLESPQWLMSKAVSSEEDLDRLAQARHVTICPPDRPTT